MKNSLLAFAEYTEILQFLSKNVRPYGLEDNRLVDVGGDESRWMFFSASMLKEKHWSVIPLWGTNLTGLTSNDGHTINLVEMIKSVFLRKNIKNIFYSIFEKSSKLWYSDLLTFSIAGGKYSIFEDFESFFSVRGEAGEIMGPYMGNLIIWPEDESFMIYSDGDNISFIAGNRAEIEGLLQAPYQYCMDQFLDYNKRNLSVPAIYVSMANFCDEHLKK